HPRRGALQGASAANKPLPGGLRAVASSWLWVSPPATPHLSSKPKRNHWSARLRPSTGPSGRISSSLAQPAQHLHFSSDGASRSTRPTLPLSSDGASRSISDPPVNTEGEVPSKERRR